ncbi:DinB family protein [Shouchella sp. JSM 1781072]|uniref:DinB family protein n=1 Tax=Shouchella sp. JSM 1781072 TaxID=3344581 RepID=UPI0035C2239E
MSKTINDLHTGGEMSATVQLFYSMVEENFLRLQASLHTIVQDEMDFKGLGNKENSIAQLIRHLAYVDLCWVFRLKGQPIPAEYEQRLGPMTDLNGKLPNVQKVPKRDLLEDYRMIITMLKKECERFTDKELERVVPYENGEKATIRWGLWHMSDHSRYHQAHINRLRADFAEALQN